MTASPTDDPLKLPQHEVQRLLGRCILRLQQYEKLMKAIVAHHQISAYGSPPISNMEERVAAASRKTLGELIGSLFGTYVITEGKDDYVEPDAPEDVISFHSRIALELSSEHYEKTQNDLKKLVSVRNTLVHHFIDQHDLWSVDGCRDARDDLLATYNHIDKQYEEIRNWAENIGRARHFLAQSSQSDVVLDLLIDGISPDGSVANWHWAGIVSALNEAAAELAIEGWTLVNWAEIWIADKYPEQVPAKYGCKSWMHVLQESRLFEQMHVRLGDERVDWYRAKEA